VVYITEKSVWAGPTRGLWFFVRGACGRDPPGGGRFLKKRLGGWYSGYSYNSRTFMMEIYPRSTSERIAQSVFRSQIRWDRAIRESKQPKSLQTLDHLTSVKCPSDQGSGAGSIFQPYPALILLAFSGASPVITWVFIAVVTKRAIE